MDPLTAAKLWMIFRPIRTLKERRAAKRAAQKAASDAAGGEFLDFDEETTMAIDLGTRTSTNMTVSGMVVWGVLKLVSTYFPGIPTDGLEELVAAVVAYIVGRLTKTPATPGAI